eukprot:RCo005512
MGSQFLEEGAVSSLQKVDVLLSKVRFPPSGARFDAETERIVVFVQNELFERLLQKVFGRPGPSVHFEHARSWLCQSDAHADVDAALKTMLNPQGRLFSIMNFLFQQDLRAGRPAHTFSFPVGYLPAYLQESLSAGDTSRQPALVALGMWRIKRGEGPSGDVLELDMLSYFLLSFFTYLLPRFVLGMATFSSSSSQDYDDSLAQFRASVAGAFRGVLAASGWVKACAVCAVRGKELPAFPRTPRKGEGVAKRSQRKIPMRPRMPAERCYFALLEAYLRTFTRDL